MVETTKVQRLDYSKFPPKHPTDLAEAWSAYKSCHEPPGLLVEWFQGRGCGEWTISYGTGLVYNRRHDRREDGRKDTLAIAWAWYDRRHQMIESILVHRGRGWMNLARWPQCLAWSDEQVAQIERWLNDSAAETPEVFRGGWPLSPVADMDTDERFSLPRISEPTEHHTPSDCQDPTLDRVASIVAYLHRVAEQQDGYAKNSEGARWHPGDRPEGAYVYTKRLRERAFMARALAKRIARGEDLRTEPGAT